MLKPVDHLELYHVATYSNLPLQLEGGYFGGNQVEAQSNIIFTIHLHDCRVGLTG